MRNFTPETETQLLKKFGTEPMIVVAIDWVRDGNISFYTDREIIGQPVEGRILDISTLDSVFILENNSDSKEISFTLDDSDGILKDIINNNDIHGRPVSIFHWDASTPIENRALLFNGVINSPIVWDEGDRTLKITVLNKIEDAEYGFSLDESLGIPNQPLNLQGKAWPLCFGTVVNVPALRLTDLVEGKTETFIGIRDFTLIPKYNYLISCSKCFSCRQGSTFNLTDNTSTPNFGPCSNCNRRVCVEIRKLEFQIVSQTNLQPDSVTISGANRFPQGQLIILKIDGARFIGLFDGTDSIPSSKFIIQRNLHAKWDEIGSTSAQRVVNTLNAEINNLIDTKCGPADRDLINVKDICNGIPLDTADVPQNQTKSVENFWRVFNAWPSAGFQHIDPDSRVTLAASADIAYVANLIAADTDSEGLPTATQIIRVKARKTVNGVTRLLDVPDSFYSTRSVDYGSYVTTEIIFPVILADIDKAWENDIFVTLKSAVGPNIVEILEWLINKYTNFTINSSSFASVKLDLAGWKAEFALLERGNILTLLRDIAFQARCAFYIKNNEIFLQFLAKRPAIDDLILESDVENNSLSLEHSDTESLITKFTVTWTADYIEKEKIKTILRWNVGVYGLKEKEFNFFIYSNEELVRTAATFWLLRKSQIWRRLKFKTPIHKLQLETFDNIEVQFNDFSSSNILALIEESSYDSSDYSITFSCWTPVRSGEQTEYDFAFPDDVDINTIFPPLEDIDADRFDTSAPGALLVAPILSGEPTNPLQSDTDCTASQAMTKIGARTFRINNCFSVRFGGFADKSEEAEEADTPSEGDTPTGEDVECQIRRIRDILSDPS